MGNGYARAATAAGWIVGALVLLIGLSPSAAWAQQQPAKRDSKVDQQLLDLYARHVGTMGKSATATGRLEPVLPVQGEFVTIDAVAREDAEALLQRLEALGLERGAAVGRIVSGLLPINAVAELEDLSGLQFTRAAASEHRAGSVVSQGVAALNMPAVRTQLGLDGTGTTVGVLSDSYDCLGGAATDVAAGDLPSGVAVLEESCPGTDEGRAMLQLVHDVAPGASLAFHTANGGQANFAQGIVELALIGGSDVIVDDIIYFAEPMFQDGIIAQAADFVYGQGVPYFSSAGNEERHAYESAFRDSGVPGLTGVRHDFDPGPGVDDLQSITLGTGTTFISFQWDDPYYSISGAPGADTDIDIHLFLSDGTYTGLSSAASNIGGDPIEVLGVSNSGAPIEVLIAVELFAGPEPQQMKYAWFGSLAPNEWGTDSGPLYGHANAAGAHAVGAARYDATPAFGTDPPRIESFSSAGATPIFYDLDGTRKATPETRQKPEIVAPDGTNTTFFGFEYEGDGFPNFFGTSAAAPHAAAAAAVLLQGGSFTPDDIYAAFESTAIDMDDPATPAFDVGFDDRTGYGLIDAYAAALDLGIVPSVVTRTEVVQPGDLTENGGASGWRFLLESGSDGVPLGQGQGRLVAGPDTPPLGGGSARFEVDDSGRLILVRYDLGGTRLDALTELQYQSYLDPANSSASQVPTLQFAYDADATDADTGWQGRLVFEPVYNTDQQVPALGSWQTWDALNGGSARWWASGGPLAAACGQSAPCSLSDILASYPDASFRAAGEYTDFLVKAGGPWSDFEAGYIDVLVVGIDDGSREVVTTYDFEPADLGNCSIPQIADKRVDVTGTPYIEIDLDAGAGAVLTDVNFVRADRMTRYLEGLTASLVSGALTATTGDYLWDQAGSGNRTATFRLASDGTDAFGYFVELKSRCGEGPDQVATAYVDPQDRFAAFGTDQTAELDQPVQFALEGNFPNPFSGRTVVRYGLPERADVRMIVFDVLGREVATLADGRQAAGYHEATLDAGALPAGVYLVRLEAGSFVETRSMLLVK